MKPEIKQKWVEALRSGKYAQGEGSLRHQDKFCCLGVLCDVMGADWATRTLNGEEIEREDESYLREPVLEMAGLNHGTQKNLAHMNDSQCPFIQIADLIEKTL